ncbi:hypothetical protein EVAR_56472_1 [Eumeta japonica]|uniref:Acyltransferase 3 domain-containing protein n=1 Tax=Eumeta variegata TaxID=151549 RepID=A0A4C1XHD3_EUMVA|nr:hypothetical protein EVAR_56472_1 [Eumeta japonica]
MNKKSLACRGISTTYRKFKLRRRPELVFMSNGTVIVQSFIMVTNFLVGYRLLLSSEKYKMSFSRLPKIILDRVLRIYPMQLTAIGIAATVAVHLSDGPLWYKYATMEAEYCRDTWWQHVLFIHNFYAPKCMPQSWYMATDVQLYIISSTIMLWILSRGLDPEYVLKRLLGVSLFGVFVVAYAFELDPALKINRPEFLYQSFWGNLPSAIIGLLFASIYYRLENEKVDLSKNKGKRSDGRRRAFRGLRCDPLNKKLKPERRAAAPARPTSFLRRRNLIIYKK